MSLKHIFSFSPEGNKSSDEKHKLTESDYLNKIIDNQYEIIEYLQKLMEMQKEIFEKINLNESIEPIESFPLLPEISKTDTIQPDIEIQNQEVTNLAQHKWDIYYYRIPAVNGNFEEDSVGIDNAFFELTTDSNNPNKAKVSPIIQNSMMLKLQKKRLLDPVFEIQGMGGDIVVKRAAEYKYFQNKWILETKGLLEFQ